MPWLFQYRLPMRQRRKIYLREWRKHRNATQERLAEYLHMSKGHLSKIENGERQYTQDFLEAAAEYLQCDPQDILMRDPTDPEGIWSIWDRVKPVDKEAALRMLSALAGDNAGKNKKTG